MGNNRRRRNAEAQLHASRPAPRKWRTSSKVLLGIAIAIAAAGVLVGAWFFFSWFDRVRFVHQRGEPAGALAMEDHVVLFDKVSIRKKDNRGTEYDDYRLRVTVVDAATGHERAKALFDPASGCLRATSDRMWCELDGKAAVVDARTLRVIGTARDALAKANLPTSVPGRRAFDGANAWFVLDDGRIARIDAALAVSTGEHAPDTATFALEHGGSGPIDHLTTPSRCDAASTRDEPGSGERVARMLGSASASTELQPRFVHGAAAAAVAAHGDALILSREAISKPDERLARIKGDGTTKWTLELHAACESIGPSGDAIVVSTSDSHFHRALAIDAETGATRWTFDP